jgi:hypothetical protein
MFSRWPIRVLLTGTVLFGAGIGLLMAAIPNQGRTQFFGSSGGNVNDISKSFCCSGTLGSLVKDNSGVQYILSNNHVLADTDQAAPGQNISQPGLVDNDCRPATTVAHFTVAPHLGTNVDAALAKLVAGTMNSGGSILGVGVPNPAPVSAKINMGVAKSGRTTGLTCGSVQSVNTSVKVQYQKGCNQGLKFTISYTNQVVVASSTFSAGGDSGSLIVSKSAAHPTALLFAGSSTTTVGNPIGQVLSHVSSSLGKQVSFVGSSTRTTNVSCPVAAAVTSAIGGPSRVDIDRVDAVKQAHESDLMADPAVMAVGIGADERNSAVITVYVETGRTHGAIPAELEGVPIRIIGTDRIRAYGWNERQSQAAANSRSARHLH